MQKTLERNFWNATEVNKSDIILRIINRMIKNNLNIESFHKFKPLKMIIDRWDKKSVDNSPTL